MCPLHKHLATFLHLLGCPSYCNVCLRRHYVCSLDIHVFITQQHMLGNLASILASSGLVGETPGLGEGSSSLWPQNAPFSLFQVEILVTKWRQGFRTFMPSDQMILAYCCWPVYLSVDPNVLPCQLHVLQLS